MKPRIRLRFGIWDCTTWDLSYPIIFAGYGYTPKEAWEDWLKQVYPKKV